MVATPQGDPPQLLHALGEQIGMVQFQRRVGFKIVFEAWRKQRDGHIGMLFIL
jgi:hypothetical protein